MTLRVLVTRPEPENQRSCDFIRLQGWRPVSLPMMHIAPFDSDAQQSAIRSQIFHLDEYAAVIFVSKNAARLGVEFIDECWPMAPANLSWIGIGSGTTQLLKDAGLPAISNPGHTTETLLDWLKPVNLRQKKVLIVRGAGGRPALADGLEAKGAKVDYLELYERKAPTYTAHDALFLDDFDIIWATSAEGVDNLTQFAKQCAPNWMSVPIIVPSERVKDTCHLQGWEKVLCSKGADDANLTLATKDFLGHK